MFFSSYCASVFQYAAMVRAGKVTICDGEQAAGTRHSLNRCSICGANGVVPLSVPIDKASRFMPVRDILISNHGDWRRLHWGAIFSAYGKTPFFDYIAPELEPIIKGNQKFIFDLNEQLLSLFIDFLDLPVAVHYSSDSSLPKAEFPPSLPEYHQIWSPRHGFQPGLSILDLLCNMGREAIFVLRQQ